MSDDAAADERVFDRHGVNHVAVHHIAVHHVAVHHVTVHHIAVHHVAVHHIAVHHIAVHVVWLFSDEEHRDRLSDDAIFAAKILKKLLLMEGTVAHLIGGKAVNSAARWVLVLDNVSFCVLLLERVELGADGFALVRASATPGVENETNSKSLDLFSHGWLGSKHVEGALSLHGVFWELTEFDLATVWKVKELTDGEGWLVELGGNVRDRGRLELLVGRVMTIGHNWLIWHDRLWLRSGLRLVMILLLCIWVVVLLLLLLLLLSIWINLLLLLVMHNLAWVGNLMLLLLLLSIWVSLLLLLLSIWVRLLLLSMWVRLLLLSIWVRLLLLSMWVSLLLLSMWVSLLLLLSVWIHLLLLLSLLVVGLSLLLLLLLSWLMV